MDALYQEQILALAKAARAQPPVANPDHKASVSNPTCGDRVDIALTMDGAHISSAGATVRGCALCEAGTGLLLALIPHKTVSELEIARNAFADWLAGEDQAPIESEMQKFMPVRTIRNRHKCVLLSFEAALAALSDDNP